MQYFLNLSRIIGIPVTGRADEFIGRLRDAVARVRDPGDERFPPLTGLVIRVGGLRGHNVFVPWEAVRELSAQDVRLASSRLDLRPFERRDGELLVSRDVLDKQIVDVRGRRVVRVNDVELAPDPLSAGGWRVAGADVSAGGFIARVLPRSVQTTVRRRLPSATIPWDQVQFFASNVPGVRLRVDYSNLARIHPADLAELIADLSYRQGEEVLASLDDPTAADVLENLPSGLQSAVLAALAGERAGDILDEMDPDMAADLLGELPEAEAHHLLEEMDPEEAADVTRLMAFDPDTAGGLMTSDFVSMPGDLTAQEAIDRLRTADALPPSVPYIYVTRSGSDPRLAGAMGLLGLLRARPDQSLASLVSEEFISVRPSEPADDAAELLARYDLVALPVVGTDGQLLGIITIDDALDVLLPDDQARAEWKPRLPRIFR